MSLYSNVRTHVRRYLQHAWIVIVPGVLFFVGAALWATVQKDQYSASSTMIIRTAKPADALIRPAFTNTARELMRTVRARLLAYEPVSIVTRDNNLYPEIQRTHGMEAAVRTVQRQLVIKVDGNASTINVRYSTSEGEDPAQTCANVVNQLVKLFRDRHSILLTQEGSGIKRFLEKSEKISRKEFQEAELTLQSFREQHRGSLPGDEDGNREIIRLSEQRVAAAKANQERNRYSLDNLQIELFRARENLRLNREELPADEELSQMRGIVRDLRRELILAQGVHTDDSDVIKGLREQIVRGQDSIKQMIKDKREQLSSTGHVAKMYEALIQMNQRNVQTLTKQNELSQRTIKQAHEAITVANSNIVKGKKLAAEYDALVHDVERAKTRRGVLEAKLQAADIQVRFGERDEAGATPVEVHEKAFASSIPVGPKRIEMSLMGLALGLAIGVGLAIVKEKLDRSVRDSDDLRLLLPGAVVVTLPDISSGVDRAYRFASRSLLIALLAGAVAIAVFGLGVRMGWWGDPAQIDALARSILPR